MKKMLAEALGTAGTLPPRLGDASATVVTLDRAGRLRTAAARRRSAVAGFAIIALARRRGAAAGRERHFVATSSARCCSAPG